MMKLKLFKTKDAELGAELIFDQKERAIRTFLVKAYLIHGLVDE